MGFKKLRFKNFTKLGFYCLIAGCAARVVSEFENFSFIFNCSFYFNFGDITIFLIFQVIRKVQFEKFTNNKISTLVF